MVLIVKENIKIPPLVNGIYGKSIRTRPILLMVHNYDLIAILVSGVVPKQKSQIPKAREAASKVNEPQWYVTCNLQWHDALYVST